MTDAVGIQAHGLTKRFASFIALDDVSFKVVPGEIMCLLGPNGAGKSTLLRILSGIVLPDAGSATVAGFDVVERSEDARAQVGLVLGEERSFYWRLPVIDNLEFFGILHGMSRRNARARASAVLAEFDMEDHAARRFSDLSSGMKARLALARARMPEPKVLLLDEPTRSIDPEASIWFRKQLRSSVEAGACALMATHDLHEASATADRIIILRNGKVMASMQGATASELELMLAGSAS